MPPKEKDLKKIIITSAISIATKLKAASILVCSDTLEDLDVFKEVVKKHKLIFATRDTGAPLKGSDFIKNVLLLPNMSFNRIGRIKLAIIKGISAGLVKNGDKMVCVSGVPKSSHLDNILVLDIGKESEVFTSAEAMMGMGKTNPMVFEAALNLALDLSHQGREGKPVGTIFVIGDHEKVTQLSRQMIINPFRGYSDEERNILDQNLRETIKEFSAIDGAFIIREDGTLIAAGRHLSAALESEDFPRGLGSRHLAAAGITSVTEAVAIVISESTGSVRIFKGGRIFMELEKSTKQ
ncbi:MAG: DNA integrity scanning protein DisA nucleotide-binding domain protein [Nitrospinae bacterium]|nr:DNA integrity scanning protein DisA nucleotide-binding domain protein [Nitrospinota bacterium]